MATAKVWVTKDVFTGEPKLEDFVLKEEKLPPLKQDEILVEAVYLSVDPYHRLIAERDGLVSEQVARIIESHAPGYPEGALVLGHFGWRSRSIVNVNQPIRSKMKATLIEKVQGLSPSLWLGAAGMPGITAHTSFNEKCDPKPGEVIVVSTAAGAVGSVVGQLAKLKGLIVIGISGSDEKCNYIRELGFDHVINYKKEDVSEALDKAAPDGVDIYYDNVGGAISDAVYAKLRHNGRVLICGQISTYNKTEPVKATNWNMQILFKELKIQGFIVKVNESAAAKKELISLLQQDKLKAKEHITEGFENMPKAFLELFTGANFGKAIVKA